ncbi:MAG TPA: RNA methyltransferase [Lachnospiraceae bacterium]|nr:class I SAM-dependent RNA methyltransferase [Eubacterium sp.]HBZ02492.1 RNA methyltransferase [Lachnospiraceae bacterium]
MDEIFEFIAPCHFGLESVLKKEIISLGYEIAGVEDGRVTFRGPVSAVARANIGIRTSERILLKCGSFKATTFDDLYDGIRHIPWARIIPRDGRFWVTKATTNRSKLFSQTSIQSIAKKAMVESMSSTYHVNRFTEDGEDYPVRIFIMKDEVTVGLDTTGISLHKRGYRQLVGKAPISETLAAALIMLTPWREDRLLVDPFCGSGTFPIEAAMIGANIAPGVNRDFTSCTWEKLIPKKIWYDAYDEARSLEKTDIEMHIQGYDLDSDIVKCAMKNAEDAGVAEYIHFQAKPVRELSSSKSYGFIITNPPYGERLEEKEALPELYSVIGERFRALNNWSMFLISSYEDAERYIGRKADKNRKIYNGMIKSYYYQFMGPKPPKR